MSTSWNIKKFFKLFGIAVLIVAVLFILLVVFESIRTGIINKTTDYQASAKSLVLSELTKTWQIVPGQHASYVAEIPENLQYLLSSYVVISSENGSFSGDVEVHIPDFENTGTYEVLMGQWDADLNPSSPNSNFITGKIYFSFPTTDPVFEFIADYLSTVSTFHYERDLKRSEIFGLGKEVIFELKPTDLPSVVDSNYILGLLKRTVFLAQSNNTEDDFIIYFKDDPENRENLLFDISPTTENVSYWERNFYSIKGRVVMEVTSNYLDFFTKGVLTLVIENMRGSYAEDSNFPLQDTGFVDHKLELQFTYDNFKNEVNLSGLEGYDFTSVNTLERQRGLVTSDKKVWLLPQSGDSCCNTYIYIYKYSNTELRYFLLYEDATNGSVVDYGVQGWVIHSSRTDEFIKDNSLVTRMNIGPFKSERDPGYPLPEYLLEYVFHNPQSYSLTTVDGAELKKVDLDLSSFLKRENFTSTQTGLLIDYNSRADDPDVLIKPIQVGTERYTYPGASKSQFLQWFPFVDSLKKLDRELNIDVQEISPVFFISQTSNGDPALSHVFIHERTVCFDKRGRFKCLANPERFRKSFRFNYFEAKVSTLPFWYGNKRIYSMRLINPPEQKYQLFPIGDYSLDSARAYDPELFERLIGNTSLQADE